MNVILRASPELVSGLVPELVPGNDKKASADRDGVL